MTATGLQVIGSKMKDVNYYFSVAGTFAALIPLLIGLIGFKYFDKQSKFFYFFIVFNFINDLSGYLIYTYVTNQKDWFNIQDAFYILIESCLCLLFLAATYTKTNKLYKPILWGVILLTILWIQQFIINENKFNQSILFDSVRSLMISILSAYGLLLWVEKGEAVKTMHPFWFLAGLFFYFFCGTFLFLFFESAITKVIKPANSIINILAYLSFAIGFLSLNRSVRRTQV